MLPKRFVITAVVLLCWSCTLLAQQLKLGNNPTTLVKSAVLELNSSNQGLLFPRLNDTTGINLLSPPDGLMIYFNPTRELMLRANGIWTAIVSKGTLANYTWSTSGNRNGTVKILGNLDAVDLPIYTNNQERMRITAAGNIAIGLTSTTAKLDVNGTQKLGEKGTINKNVISFASTIAVGTSINSGSLALLGLTGYTSGTTDLYFTIPAANAPTSTQATVAVSFGADLPNNMTVAYARVVNNSGTYQVKLRLNYSATGSVSISSAIPVYFTITEF